MDLSSFKFPSDRRKFYNSHISVRKVSYDKVTGLIKDKIYDKLNENAKYNWITPGYTHANKIQPLIELRPNAQKAAKNTCANNTCISTILYDLLHSRKQDASMILNPNHSYLTCLPLKLIQMERAELKRMLTLGDGIREIVGRGHLHFPILADKKVLFAEIKEKRHLSYPINVYGKQKSRNRHIPFVYDSKQYVYVLARRKYILINNGDGFNVTDYKQVCHDHYKQNIDEDLAYYVES